MYPQRSTRKMQPYALRENPTPTAVKKQQESNSTCIRLLDILKS